MGVDRNRNWSFYRSWGIATITDYREAIRKHLEEKYRERLEWMKWMETEGVIFADRSIMDRFCHMHGSIISKWHSLVIQALLHEVSNPNGHVIRLGIWCALENCTADCSSVK